MTITPSAVPERFTPAPWRLRRWLWGLFLTSCLLPILGVFQPLNKTERKLVGQWRIVTQSDTSYMTFHANHTGELRGYQMTPQMTCAWIATDEGVLRLTQKRLNGWDLVKWHLYQITKRKCFDIGVEDYQIENLSENCFDIAFKGERVKFQRESSE